MEATNLGCRECGGLKFHAPYCKTNLHRCGTHSITTQLIRDSERGVFQTIESELASLKKQLGDIEERDASICPEDVGVVELVGHLRAELALRDQRISELERERNEISEMVDHPDRKRERAGREQIHAEVVGAIKNIIADNDYLTDEACNLEDKVREMRAELATARKANEEVWGQAAKLACGYCAGHFTQYDLKAERGAPGSGNWIHRNKNNHVLTALCAATGIHNKMAFVRALHINPSGKPLEDA